MKRHAPTPLFEEAEGREADDRASLFAAWKRSNDNIARRPVTNLHVREFLLYVFATDRDGRGVKMTYEEIAMRLECTKSTARSVVDRAANEYGLLAVREDRYVDGGQTANRYSIDWQMVRSINAGIVGPTSRGPGVVSRQPPAVRAQPPAVRQQGAAVTAHPYKETPEPLPESIPETQPQLQPKRKRSTGTNPGTPLDTAVVVVLRSLGMSEGGIKQAVRAIHDRGLTPDDVHELIAVYHRERSTNSNVGIGYLCNWITGKRTPPGTNPDQPIAVARSTVTTAERRKQAANRVLYRLRRSNLSEAEKQRRVDIELHRFDRENGLANQTTNPRDNDAEVQALSELFQERCLESNQ